MTPCMMESTASSGMASLRKGSFVSRARVRRMGTSMTSPTANQVVRPMVRASAMINSLNRFAPKK